MKEVLGIPVAEYKEYPNYKHYRFNPVFRKRDVKPTHFELEDRDNAGMYFFIKDTEANRKQIHDYAEANDFKVRKMKFNGESILSFDLLKKEKNTLPQDEHLTSFMKKFFITQKSIYKTDSFVEIELSFPMSLDCIMFMDDDYVEEENIVFPEEMEYLKNRENFAYYENDENREFLYQLFKILDYEVIKYEVITMEKIDYIKNITVYKKFSENT